MLSFALRNPKTGRNQDKENVPSNANLIQTHKQQNKENTKTGIEIRNKIKNKNLFKPSSKIQNPPHQNAHILEKLNLKNFQQKKNLPPKNIDESNISQISSVSTKSVTFSIDNGVRTDRSVSQSSQKKSSILKNKLLTQRSNCEKKSIHSSQSSLNKNNDQAVESQNSNKIALLKYQKILKDLKQTHQKYTDPIYPPCEESAFLRSLYTKDFLEKLNLEGFKVRWMRLPELFPQKKKCLWHPEVKSRVTKGFIHSSGNQSNYMQTVLNSINKSYLMEKFFENQTLSSQGIYYVKMYQTQTNQWKYVIVDDYIPVMVNTKKNEPSKIVKPAFLNVESQSNLVQLWPFLIQKALAKYYSTFDSLMKGNVLDFLEEVTGEFYETIPLDCNQKDQTNARDIEALIKNPFNIILGENTTGTFFPLRSTYQLIQILDTENNYSSVKIDKTTFYRKFKQIHVIEARKFSNCLTCLIKHENLLESQKSSELEDPFILRSFTLQEKTECILGLTQKQERFHRHSIISKEKKSYGYSWIRMILVLKQSSGYRWIDSEYRCSKTIKIQTNLSPGEYFVIIMPEWKFKAYNLKLSLYSNSQTVIKRRAYQDHKRIIEQSCMDLAQRYGKLIQINNNICSYNYINYKVGFIIENINNEKTAGEVKILRTIDGLADYNITPINAEFRHKNKLQIKIPSLQSYTVVLKVSGGVDKQFLQEFDFGI